MLLTIGPDNHTGFRKQLEELSQLVNNGEFIAVKEKFSKQTLQKIIQINPSLTIIGRRNWIKRNYKILSKIPGKKGILYTSPLAQAEISNEEIKNLQIYFNWIDSKKFNYPPISPPHPLSKNKNNHLLMIVINLIRKLGTKLRNFIY